MRLALGPCLSPGYSPMPAPGFLREDSTLEGLRPRPEPPLTRRPSVPRPASLWVSPSPLDCIPQRSSQEAPREALLASPVLGGGRGLTSGQIAVDGLLGHAVQALHVFLAVPDPEPLPGPDVPAGSEVDVLAVLERQQVLLPLFPGDDHVPGGEGDR